MKKLIKFILLVLLVTTVISCNKKVTEEQARQVLHNHLEKRYGEPFYIGVMGIRATEKKMWYEAEIMPARYLDTPKALDKYYHSTGTVRINKNMWGEKLSTGADVYMGVRLNENANAYFLPKLQELFGSQVLPVIQIDAPRALGDGDFIESWKYNKEKGYFIIGGGIYIFGRVDDLEQKEEYRKKIYEFIQYMKKEEMFDEVNLAIYILDERCLTEKFENEIGNNLVNARNRLKTADEFITFREKEMEKLNEEFTKMNEKNIVNKINSFNRTYLKEISKSKYNKYSTLYHKAIYSRNFLKMELRLQYYVPLDYNILSDLKLLNTMKINYKEYDSKALYNNEWDGE